MTPLSVLSNKRASFLPGRRPSFQRRAPAGQVGAERGGVGVVGFSSQGPRRRRQGAVKGGRPRWVRAAWVRAAWDRAGGLRGLKGFAHNPVMPRRPAGRSAQVREFCVGGRV